MLRILILTLAAASSLVPVDCVNTAFCKRDDYVGTWTATIVTNNIKTKCTRLVYSVSLSNQFSNGQRLAKFIESCTNEIQVVALGTPRKPFGQNPYFIAYNVDLPTKPKNHVEIFKLWKTQEGKVVAAAVVQTLFADAISAPHPMPFAYIKTLWVNAAVQLPKDVHDQLLINVQNSKYY